MTRSGKQSRRDGNPFPTERAARREIERLLKRRRRRRFRRARLICLAAALLIGWWASRNVFLVVTVQDGAMSPAVEAGSTLICLRQSFLNALVGIVPEEAVRPARGGICLIACADMEDGAENEPALLLRRTLALPGDVIDVKDGETTVNGEAAAGDASGSDRVYPVTVPAGSLFLVGDYGAVSVDSRRRSFGMPDIDDVVARPVAVVWPLFGMRLVN